jgi:methyl-accepting chemotaxis protein
MRTGQPVGRFVGETYRYTMPLVWGQAPVTRQAICAECHERMGAKPGEVLVAYSIGLPTTQDFAALRKRIMLMAGGALAAMAVMLFAIWSLFGRVVAQPLRALIHPLEDIAGGNLVVQVPGFGRTDEIGQIANAVSQMAGRVSTTIVEIQTSGREITNASAEIATSATTLSQRTEEQAASLEETTAAMEEIAATVRKNADNARQARDFATETSTVAESGGAVVGEAVDAMARIEQSSRNISEIIGVIDVIAQQTNLLALNAAVEAARAGEAGRGFAVVASEVRTLAQRAGQAAKDIKELIVNANSQVKDGVDLVNKAGVSLRDIVASVRKVRDIVGDIADASSQQSDGVEQINNALTQMDAVTQQNSALVEENAATAKLLEHQVQAMDVQIAYFRIGADTAPSAGPSARKPAATPPPMPKAAAA